MQSAAASPAPDESPDLDPTREEFPEPPAAVMLPPESDLPPLYEGKPFFMGGRSWLVPPLNLQQARRLQAWVQSIDRQTNIDEKMRRMLSVVRVAMNRNYPELTTEHVEQLLDMGNIGEVFDAVLGQSGFRERAARKEASP